MDAIVTSFDTLFAWILRTTWQSSVVIAFVLLAQWLFRNRLPARWRYALWFLVIARMLMPAAPESPLSVFNAEQLWAAPQPADSAPVVLAPPRSVEAAAIPEHATGTSLPNPRTMLVSLWFAVVVLLGVRVAAGHYRLSARVCRQRPLTDPAILDLLEDCKEEMGIHIPISVVESPTVTSPALLGFLRPRLLLPETLTKTFGPDELRHVFRHELAHLKRGDVQVNWLISCLQILHWFNPVAWIAFHRMRADREAACDAYVLNGSTEGAGKAYGDTIIKLLEFSSRGSWLAGVVGILENRSQLKMRIRMIACFGRHSYRWSAPAVALLAVLGALTLTDGQTVGPDLPDGSDKTYTKEEVGEHPADFFFQKLGQRPPDEYHYYAAMWALGEKCNTGMDVRAEILEKAISMFNGEHDTNTKIQCLGVMSMSEKTAHSPACYELMLDTLHQHGDERLRRFAAYSLLWFRDQPTVLLELENALKTEKAASSRDSISATIKRIKAYNEE